MDLFTNKSVMLLGGTGYIGGLLLDELLKHENVNITIYSRDEYKQFFLKEEKEIKAQGRIRYCIGDVRDEQGLKSELINIDYVFDFAAMKHVQICEENVNQAIMTNVLGTENVAKCAMETKVKKVIYASSDKAVCPTNTYGATKLLAEKILYHYSNADSSTSFAVARFVNILGSRGSVLDKWKYQILNGKPVTITHPEMIRYFITGKEAVKFLMNICINDNTGNLFIPHFYRVKIIDLCQAFIDYMCERYQIEKYNIKIITVGMCPAEKMEEDVFNFFEVEKIVSDSNGMYSIDMRKENEMPKFVTRGELLKQDEIIMLIRESEYI